MLIGNEEIKKIEAFLARINLSSTQDNDKARKIKQILAYLEVVHSQVRKYSSKRELVFVDGCAGNSHLSFLIYYFYTVLVKRPVRVHCVDMNEKLMDKNRKLAVELEFENMHFHASDISDYEHSGNADVVYSLHACDTATDKVIYLGLKSKARHILSVSCCQHTIKMKSNSMTTAVTKHSVFKGKLTNMMGDSLRALLLEMQGYKAAVIEFVSSHSTDKNILIRAQRGQVSDLGKLQGQYDSLHAAFNVSPALADYIARGSSKEPSHLEREVA